MAIITTQSVRTRTEAATFVGPAPEDVRDQYNAWEATHSLDQTRTVSCRVINFFAVVDGPTDTNLYVLGAEASWPERNSDPLAQVPEIVLP